MSRKACKTIANIDVEIVKAHRIIVSALMHSGFNRQNDKTTMANTQLISRHAALRLE